MATAAAEEKTPRTKGWRTLLRFLPMLWPDGERELKIRVVVAVLLVLVGKAATLGMPFLYKAVIDRMLAPVDWANTKLFVEYGPGVGTFTRPILERLPADATLVTIDTNPEFTRYLKESIDDPRLVAVTGSAVDVEAILTDRNLGSADYVLSGLPFSTLPPGVGDSIAKATGKKQGIGFGGVLGILLGVGLLAGIGYAVWQTLRADDDLWVADEDPDATKDSAR